MDPRVKLLPLGYQPGVDDMEYSRSARRDAVGDWASRKFKALPPPTTYAPGRPKPDVAEDGAAAAESKPHAESSKASNKKRKQASVPEAASAKPPAVGKDTVPAAVGDDDDDAGFDELFGGLVASKRVARERAAETAKAEAEAAAIAQANAKRDRQQNRQYRERDSVFGEEYDPDVKINPMKAKVHRFDNPSGLNVYKAHALGLGRGGGTPLCPFDCNCCF